MCIAVVKKVYEVYLLLSRKGERSVTDHTTCNRWTWQLESDLEKQDLNGNKGITSHVNWLLLLGKKWLLSRFDVINTVKCQGSDGGRARPPRRAKRALKFKMSLKMLNPDCYFFLIDSLGIVSCKWLVNHSLRAIRLCRDRNAQLEKYYLFW